MTHGPTNPPKGEWADPPMGEPTNPPTHKRMIRLNVEIPEDLYLAIHARAGKLRTNKKDIVEELLRAGVREVANFVRLRRDHLHDEPINTMVKDYKEYHASSTVGEVEPIDEEEKEMIELAKTLIQTD